MMLLSFAARFPGKVIVATVVGVWISACVSSAAVVDLTTAESSGTANGAIFLQFDPDKATGTGLIDAFVRVQATGTEEGYNTDGALEFDTKSGTFTHSLRLGDVPTVTLEGTEYREFLLDINESRGSNSLLSLDELKIYVEDAGDLSGHPGAFAAPVFDLDAGGDNWVKLDAELNSGSGGGDMLGFIPSDLFGGDETKFVYVYSKFGINGSSGGGFEEWAVGKGAPIIPEPATLCMLCIGALTLCPRRRR